MVICPCKNCEKKGCGPYHDQCEAYQKYVQDNRRYKQEQKQKKDDLWNRSNGPNRYW